MNKEKLIAIVGLGAILPDAADVSAFWGNILANKYSITEVPADRWDVNLYYDPDRSAVDKTYAKIGAFIKGYQFQPLKLGLIIPPKVLTEMDYTQQWALEATHQALRDYGFPAKVLDNERVAVILGNANAGEYQYRTTYRILLPEYIQALKTTPEFENLPADVKNALLANFSQNIQAKAPPISEDTMSGELSNIISGRVANMFNFTGPNFVTDAACASSLAAIQTACHGLIQNKYDAVITGGIDRHMGPETYIKFAKIGALSASGSRPYADGADGFVMGEGAVIFLMKRLADAEKAGDKIYAVISGIGSSSDGKGKGITAPNPVGQQKAIQRAWQDAGVLPEAIGLVEGHGTSTKVGDLAEVNSLNAIFGSLGLAKNSVILSSVKSNIGHLKSAAGAVGLLKTVLALHHKVLPPTANFHKPNPAIDFNAMPFLVSRDPLDWRVKDNAYRYAGVSSFGFGGTNFHVVLAEHLEGMGQHHPHVVSMPSTVPQITTSPVKENTPLAEPSLHHHSAPIDNEQIKTYVLTAVSEKTGYPIEMLELDLDLEADLGIDTVKQAELFAAVRSKFNIPRREDLILSEYNTLAKVVNFVAQSITEAPSSLGVETSSPIADQPQTPKVEAPANSRIQETVIPYQGLFFASAETLSDLKDRCRQQLEALTNGQTYSSVCPSAAALALPHRLAIDFVDQTELQKKLERCLPAFDTDNLATWKALQAHGVYYGTGKPGKIAFLFPGQGSQYVNMLLDFHQDEPIVKETFAEADRIMTPILGRPLTSYIYTDGSDDERKQAEQELKNTAITQPAMLTANIALMRVLNKFGVYPDLVIGHSLGEYAALVAAGVMTFAEALEVVSARGREMTRIQLKDQGSMAAVSAPLQKVEEIIQTIDEYVVIANINSPMQAVLGGTTAGIDAAVEKCLAQGLQAVKIPVSHAFHTRIVAPASQPMREVIARMNIQKPTLPVVANVTGELYPTDRESILDYLANQVASPVQFVKGLNTLYENGVRIFIESGPKRVLNALATDTLKEHSDITVVATNHPRKGGKASFNEALCNIYAAGVINANTSIEDSRQASPVLAESSASSTQSKNNDKQDTNQAAANSTQSLPSLQAVSTYQDAAAPATLPITGSVVISGLGLGLPGRSHRTFDDSNFDRILHGDMFIQTIDESTRQAILDKHVTRLVKSEAGAVMEEISDLDQVLKLAGLSGEFDLAEEFGVPEDRVQALDVSTKLAIAAGIEALRNAGIPLVMAYRRTTTGTLLPDRWKLPEALRDETGVIFGSAFPGLHQALSESDRFHEAKYLETQIAQLRSLRSLAEKSHSKENNALLNELDLRLAELEKQQQAHPYLFDRRYIFRVLAMGHSQFAEYIGARGPNTHVNAACATTTHAVSIAEDWIRTGRCRRVVIIAGDDVTQDESLNWIGSSLFASGAATTEGDLRLAAVPFDKRRNGMIIGMGAAAMVLESEDAARERGVRGIAELLASHTANSAFHGTRLDIQHVSQIMNQVLSTAEQRFGLKRQDFAKETVFMSHETYTPARGGSASAEIHALRSSFGSQANQVIIANTKGFTGHSMGVGIEDVVVTKALETGLVPPIAHIQHGFEPDPDLGDLNLSQGGAYNPQFALRLGAGFGSQIAMTLMRRIPGQPERIDQTRYSSWLAKVSGYESPELEQVQRTLRIKDQGVPQHEPALSAWQYGQLPTQWAFGQAHAETEAYTVPVNHSVAAPAAVKPETKPERTEPPTARTSEMAGTSSPDAEAIKNHVLAQVSEKTGYPTEMLDLDLDLEADLGIDTVKQAELFAAIRTHYDIPRREDLILSEYNTLAKVIGFVQESLSAQPAVAAAKSMVSSPVVTEAANSEEQSSMSENPAKAAISSSDQSANAPSAQYDEIKSHLLTQVSEKTGYPTEMLDLDLDLEADLGIDTVKQAELFAAIRNHYQIPRRENLILSDYNTLAKVIGFVEESLAAPVTQPAAAESQTALADSPSPASPVQPDSTQTEYSEQPESGEETDLAFRSPTLVLIPRLALCNPTEVELANRDVLILNLTSNTKLKNQIDQALAKKLKSLKANPISADLDRAAALLETAKQAEKLAGIYFISDAGETLSWSELSAETWVAQRTKSLNTLFELAQALPEKAFVITATFMGGLQGLLKPQNPLSGLVSGFTKALHREKPGQLIKTIDLESSSKPAHIAEILLQETLHDSETCEIGYEGDSRFAVTLRQTEIDTKSSQKLAKGSTFVVSGATGGITASVLHDLAKATRGTFYLLGRSQLPAGDDANLHLLKTDKDSLRQKIQSEAQSAGEKLTPLQIEQKIGSLQRSAAMLQTIAEVQALGASVEYIRCDVTDYSSVEKAVADIAAKTTAVDYFIHAAGVEKSRKIEKKTIDEVEQTVSTKTDGLYHLLQALDKHHRLPKGAVLFSSVAGRFGNAGQVDYSAANDALSKLSYWLPTALPELKVVSIDWGAWAEVGMASRGSIPLMMERLGIEMLKPASAAPMVCKALENHLSGEFVVAGSLGLMEQGTQTTCGIDLQKADRALREGTPEHLMSSNLTSYNIDHGIRLEAELDPTQLAYLRDHVINGIPVLPGVVGIEGFTIAARHIASVLGSGSRGFEVHHLENIRFLAPFKFYGNKRRVIQWNANAYRLADGIKVEATLESDIQRHNGQSEHWLHFAGDLYLTPAKQTEGYNVEPPDWQDTESLTAGEIYTLYFHGPSFQVLESAQKVDGAILGKLNKQVLKTGADEPRLLATPLLIEMLFQTAGLYEAGATGKLALPQSVGNLKLFKQPVNGLPIYAEIEPRWEGTNYCFSGRVVDADGNVFLEMNDYRTSSFPFHVQSSLLEPLRRLVRNN